MFHLETQIVMRCLGFFAVESNPNFPLNSRSTIFSLLGIKRKGKKIMCKIHWAFNNDPNIWASHFGILSSASSSCTPTFFFLHSHNFLNSKTDLDLLFEKEPWVIRNWDMGVCYGFINPELNIFFFLMRGCSKSNFCINY